MTTPNSQSPEQARHFRIGRPAGFLPLSEDTNFSTRGQHLPALIQSQSSGNVHDARKYASPNLHTRRRSSFGSSDLHRTTSSDGEHPNLSAIGHDLEAQSLLSEDERRRMSILMTPEMRSQRLIGNSNPRYHWGQYWKTESQLNKMPKKLRAYYERNNYLIQQYMYIDRLLDSTLPHQLMQEYDQPPPSSFMGNGYGTTQPAPIVPPTIAEEPSSMASSYRDNGAGTGGAGTPNGDLEAMLPNGELVTTTRVKRTPKDIFRHTSAESTPLLRAQSPEDGEDPEEVMPPDLEFEDEADSGSRVVTIAIYINFVANACLLIMKIAVAILTDSVSVLASLVDAALDFLSTAIIWTTTFLIKRKDTYRYPVGRRRLEPIGVLVFSVIMIVSFVQVALEGLNKLSSPDHSIVSLTIPAIVIMAATVGVKFLCWLYCRLIPNSSVQALAQDAITDIVFNTFSIIFPLLGYYFSIWWLDPLGGVLLSLYVIFSWASTSSSHIKNLTGAAATADQRNVLLYLTMRFAHTIRKIQGLQAYHSGDKLNVEVDLVLDEGTSLRDSHDLGESLQYVLESVPEVDRAFVHMDYKDYNLPSHMNQD